MKFVQQCRWLVMLILSGIVLVGCETPITYQQQYDDAQKQACKVQRQIAQEKLNSSVVQVHNQFYASDVYHSGDSPVWLASRVTIRGNNMPLEMLMNKVVPTNAVGIQYAEDATKDQLISIDYAGSVRGALDKVAAQTGYAYDIEGNMLTWLPYITKTFDVSFMPGTSEYLVGQKQGDSMFNTTTNSNNTASGQQNDSQFSSLAGNVSVWNDLQNSIQQMLSPTGKVMVSQSTTTVTVHDRPQNVQDVADYLASMNRDLSKEVLLQVHVYQVALDKNFNFGINWNLAYQSAARAGFGTGNVSQPLTQNPLGTSAPGGAIFPAVAGVAGSLFNNTSGIPGISAGVVSGPFANTQLLINALQQQGTVANITNPEVVTLNNQVAQIDISTQTTYLASSTTTLTAGATATNTGFAQTSLNPGVVDTGFKLYILPKIMNGNVYLEVSSELSSLDSLNTFTAPGGGSSIQLPVVSGKHFNLRSLVPNTSTLIIGGFKTVDSTSAHNSEFGFFGGSGADNANKETILLITPTILGNNT